MRLLSTSAHTVHDAFGQNKTLLYVIRSINIYNVLYVIRSILRIPIFLLASTIEWPVSVNKKDGTWERNNTIADISI